jgi:hypothetical protein
MSRLEDALFDDLQIVPVWTRPLLRGRSASPCIVMDPPPLLEHRFPVAAFPIRGHSFRLLGTSTLLELAHQYERDFFLLFGNGPSNAQPTLYLKSRAAPKSASSLLFAVLPFSPLCPT